MAHHADRGSAITQNTIAHSFRHFGATIGWLEGHEDDFLRATLKADLFRIVFDGFDEYILRNMGAVQPLEVLETLAELAKTTGTRIVITSRTSFWNTNLPEAEVEAFIERTGSLVFTILPFKGIVFRITPTGDFTDIANAVGSPLSGLIQATDGNLYGVAIDPPIVYTITLSDEVLGILHGFWPKVSGPIGLVQDTDGNLYGTTMFGGSYNKITAGSVFKITPAGAFTNLHNFSGPDGGNPFAVLYGGCPLSITGNRSASASNS